MNFQNFSISKSSFLKFEQCPKAFFLYKNLPFLRDKAGIDKQLTFNRGHRVGNLAQQLFPGGTDVTTLAENTQQAIEKTAELIASGHKILYEAAFLYEGLLVMVDILHLHEGRYYAYEVKSSLKISEVYVLDACLQYYVLSNRFDNLEDFFLVTLNGDYTLEGELDVKKLFKRRSIKKEAEKNLPYFRERLKEVHLTLEKNVVPDIRIGKQCYRPYVCDFFGNCWKGIEGQYSIFNLPMVNKETLFEWNQSGIRTMAEVDEQLLPEKIRPVRTAILQNKAFVNRPAIARLLASIRPPYAAMDMEIWSAAIPQLQGTRPFQQLPFLFCVDDLVTENYFLCDHYKDERKLFAIELIDQCKAYNTLLVYDKTLEDQVINSLIQLFPDLASELAAIKPRLLDISDIFKNLDYYELSFQNNFTLKAVAEGLKLDVKFDRIRSGLEAMNVYERYRSEENAIEKQVLKEDLIRYCFSDTRAVLCIVRFLFTLMEESH